VETFQHGGDQEQKDSGKTDGHSRHSFGPAGEYEPDKADDDPDEAEPGPADRWLKSPQLLLRAHAGLLAMMSISL
jgi:hypothetical protein